MLPIVNSSNHYITDMLLSCYHMLPSCYHMLPSCYHMLPSRYHILPSSYLMLPHMLQIVTPSNHCTTDMLLFATINIHTNKHPYSLHTNEQTDESKLKVSSLRNKRELFLEL